MFIFISLQIFLKSRITYEDKDGNVVKDLRHIAIHYATNRKGFVIDCIALLPYEILAHFVPDGSLRKSLQLYLKLPHLVRVVRISWLFSEEQKKLNQRQEDYRIIYNMLG